MPEPNWKAYERQIARRLRARAAPGADVSFDEGGRQRLAGRFSGIDRQIDVIVRGQFAGLEGDLTMIVDCKCWSRAVDVSDVERFWGLVDDVAAEIGLLVTTVGYSEAAKRRAKGFRTVSLDVVELDELSVWLPRRPTVAVTSGAGTATLSYWDDGELRSEVVDPSLAHKIIESYRDEPEGA